VDLDKRAAGVRGASTANPHSLVQEFLNRSDAHDWGVVSNGLRLRILRDNQALSRQSFLECDLEAMFAGEIYSDFALLWLIVHATRFATIEDDHHKTCLLEKWTKFADEQGTRALGDLRGGVEMSLQILGEGFTSHANNVALRDALRSGAITPINFHGQLLRVVYRLTVLDVCASWPRQSREAVTAICGGSSKFSWVLSLATRLSHPPESSWPCRCSAVSSGPRLPRPS
jgi:hypothetical protein